MAEQMREFTETTELSGLAEAFSEARKVTVDMATRTAYVFSGRSNRATMVTGEEFDALVKTLPAVGELPDEVEPVEAVISVVKEDETKARPSRGQKKER